MKKQSLLQGAFILSTVGLINRLMGFVLRIILVKTIGDEGLGIFQMVYPFYITLLLISTAGFPLAISKLIPEKKQNERSSYALYLLKLSLIFVTVTSAITALFTIINAKFISKFILEDSRSYYSILILSPVLFITTLASIFRSFFQGFQNMIPTAISQLTEQISRFAATIMIMSIIASLQLSYKAAGVAAGIFIGESAGLIFLIIYFIIWYQREKNNIQKVKRNENIISTYKKIAAFALPITAGRIIHSIMKSFEAVLIPAQLKASGLLRAEATALFGQLSGMVEQVIFLPAVITTGLTISLIPNISNYFALKKFDKIRKNYEDVLRIITYMGIPVALLFYRYGTEICELLFGYAEAGIILSSLSAAAPFIYFLQVSSAMLNGLGKPLIAVRNISIASIIKIFLIYILVSRPEWRITGAATAAATAYITASLLNYYSIKFKINYKMNFMKIIAKPLFSTVIVYIMQPFITSITQFLPYSENFKVQNIYIFIISALFYLINMILLRAITLEDIKRLKF